MSVAEKITPPKKWTYSEYNALPDAAERYEILEGELSLPPSPNIAHQIASGELLLILAPYIKAHRLGMILAAPIDTYWDEENTLQPDIVYIGRGRMEIVKKARIEGSPDLVVEILSPYSIRRDRIRKMRAFARFGVPYYWIVDPENHTIESYHLQEGRYALEASGTEDETFRSALFPELEIPLASLWQEPSQG